MSTLPTHVQPSHVHDLGMPSEGPIADAITATVAVPSGSSTSVGGRLAAIPSIFACRVRVMKSWLTGSCAPR